ncbi:MAG: flagellar export protein FliJ [Oscillospiraceae bacterium]|nr:flagellar export protein FliJ [Oscillospiraceae bacterium]
MKKFNFSLEKLYGYKEQVLSKEKNDLAQYRSEKQQLLEEKERLERLLAESGEEFAEKAAVGMSIVEINVIKDYQKSLTEDIRLKEREIEAAEERISGQLRVVIQASKDVNSLEKLRDKQLDEYKFKVAKSDEQFIEEFVTTSSYRSG